MKILRPLSLVVLLAPLSAIAGDGFWSPASPPGVHVHDLVVAESVPGRLVAVSRGDGAFRSDDAGTGWYAISSGLTNLDLSAVAVAPDDADRIIVAQVDGVLQLSTDGGASWAAGVGGAVQFVTAIAFDPAEPLTVYALDDDADAVLKSTDGGASWTDASVGLPKAGAGDQWALVVADDGVVYAGASGGVHRSTDGGQGWATEWISGSEVSVQALAAHRGAQQGPVVSGSLVVGGTGAMWTRSGPWLRVSENDDAVSLAIDGNPRWPGTSDPRWRALAGGPDGVSASVDFGASPGSVTHFYMRGNHWIDFSEGLAGPVTKVSFDPNDRLRYFAVAGGTVHRRAGEIATDLRIRGDSNSALGTLRLITGYEDSGPDGLVGAQLGFEVVNQSAVIATDVKIEVEFNREVLMDPVPCTATGSGFICTSASLSERSELWTPIFHVAESGPLEVTVKVSSAEIDATPSNNVVTRTANIENHADLAPEEPDGTDPPQPPEASTAPPPEAPAADDDHPSVDEAADDDDAQTPAGADRAAVAPAGKSGGGGIGALAVMLLTLLRVVRRRLPVVRIASAPASPR